MLSVLVILSQSLTQLSFVLWQRYCIWVSLAIFQTHFFLSSHTKHIVWVEFLLCGRPAGPHSHTHTPRCGPRGLVLSWFQQPDICCIRLLSNILVHNHSGPLCIYLLVCLVCFNLFFKNLPLSKLKLWKKNVCLQEKRAKVLTDYFNCITEGQQELGEAGGREGKEWKIKCTHNSQILCPTI